MKIINRIYFFFLLSSFIFISCNSETSPTADKLMSEFFPTTTGSWWKYENWRLDSTGTRDSLLNIDSMVIEGITTIGGREVYLMVDYNLTAVPVYKDTSFITLEGGKLNYYMNLNFGDGDTIQWITYADLNYNEWLLFEKNIIRDSNFTRTEFYYKMAGKKGVIQDFTVKNTTFKAQQIYINSIQRGGVTTPTDTMSYNSEDETLFLYGKGVGLAYMKYMMTKTSSPPLQGYETTLIDYKIK